MKNLLISIADKVDNLTTSQIKMRIIFSISTIVLMVILLGALLVNAPYASAVCLVFEAIYIVLIVAAEFYVRKYKK